MTLPQGTLVCNFVGSHFVGEAIEAAYEPVELHAHQDLRRVDTLWRGIADKPRWLRTGDKIGDEMRFRSRAQNEILSVVEQYMMQYNRRSRAISVGNLWVADHDVQFYMSDEFAGIRSQWRVYLKPGTPIALIFHELSKGIADGSAFNEFYIVSVLAQLAYEDGVVAAEFGGGFQAIAKRLAADFSQFSELCHRFISAYELGPKTVFDTSVWSRRAGG
jgi:hypothetical protein